MKQTPLKINVGAEEDELVIPTVEGCLEDNAFKFYSAQNAIRVHEWIRGTSLDPLVLEAVKPGVCGVVEHYSLGNLNVQAYADYPTPGRLMSLEQTLVAVPKIKETMRKNIEYYETHPSERNQELISSYTQEMMNMLSPIWAFNASNMFFGTPIPKRFIFQTMETLNILFTVILTQRDKVQYSTEEELQIDLPDGLYSENELKLVLTSIHQSVLEGNFYHPETMAKNNNLLSTSFFKQCAMAISAYCGIKIPRDYVEETTDSIYFWAVKQLTKVLDSIEDLEMRQNTQNVVNLFQKA